MPDDKNNPKIDDTKLRMRKRFQVIDDTIRLKKEASPGWIYTFYIGFAMYILGFFVLLISQNILTYSLELVGSVILILIGFMFIFTSFHLRNTVEFYVGENF